MSEIGQDIGTGIMIIGGIIWLLFAHKIGPRGGKRPPLITTSHVWLYDFLSRALVIGGMILIGVCSE